jgi:hypothetical protein
MVIRGTITVACPACGTRSDAELVQSINARTNPELKQKLLAGDLNVLVCTCGHRTQLAANVLFHDPDADYFCHVVPGGETEMQEAAAAFAASGATGTQRLVPSTNALIEKVKILDAGLLDWAIEMTKVLLLASIGERELERVLLFEAKDGELLHWILFDEDGRAPTRVSSPFASYAKASIRERSAPKRGELRIDRAWAVDAVQQMIAAAN